ncbi:MAG: CDP-glycerol glycerophosphotransferase family protein [Pseudomonas sp.]|nr:MAG: CDP-glycerol glycerophosphotransferase family protein [Pseudomonas sp.]
MKIFLRQWGKIFLQILFLPVLYWLFSFRRIREEVVIFADSNGTSVPFSMKVLHRQLAMQKDFIGIDFFYDFKRESLFSLFCILVKFMWLYAGAGNIVLCNYFLPVSSCRKKEGTKVIQLWHSGGLLKKIANDAVDDIPSYYVGDLFRNYDWLVVSAPSCRETLARAMKIAQEKITALGMSRTDAYYDMLFLNSCRKEFYKTYPEAAGKQVVLWAPTFRGTAGAPSLVGEDAIIELQRRLPEEYFLVCSVHPHLRGKTYLPSSSMPTEWLLASTDILITDYSSILFDYLIFERPLILFAPDFDLYQKGRGLYIDYYSLPGEVVHDAKELLPAVQRAQEIMEYDSLIRAREYYMECCDGQATDRLLALMRRS